MARRYKRYHRVIPGMLGAAIGAYRTGRTMGSLAMGRFKRKFNAWRKSKKKSYRINYRKYRRHSRKFLRSIGLRQNKICTLVHRGNATRQGPTTAAIFDIGYWTMNNPHHPTDSQLGATWDSTATGFNHMASLYEKFMVIGARLRVTIRNPQVMNLAAATSGTTITGAALSTIPMKIGLLLSEGIQTSYKEHLSLLLYPMK